MKYYCVLETLMILSALSALLVNCAPTDKNDKAAAKSYLRKYGHIDKDSDDNITDSDLDIGLISFQNFNGLPATGVLDAATKAQMAKSRCGLPDKVKGQSNSHRSRRYVLGGQWATRTLTYYLQNLPTTASSLTQTQVADIISRAYKAVDRVYSFGRTSFRTYDHGDGYPFDGPLKVLAHAFYPSDGRLHFDDSETWTTATTTEGLAALKALSTRSAGETQLGLGHSSVLSAVMYPYYNGYLSNFALDPDDIVGMQTLYGYCPSTVKPTTTKATTVKPTTTPKPTTTKATTIKPTTTSKPTTIKPTTTPKPTTTKATTVKPTTTPKPTTAPKVTSVNPSMTTKAAVFCIQQ